MLPCQCKSVPSAGAISPCRNSFTRNQMSVVHIVLVHPIANESQEFESFHKQMKAAMTDRR